jgi:hypothetical protein
MTACHFLGKPKELYEVMYVHILFVLLLTAMQSVQSSFKIKKKLKHSIFYTPGRLFLVLANPDLPER